VQAAFEEFPDRLPAIDDRRHNHVYESYFGPRLSVYAAA
jgi:hypothetical protein